MNELVVSNFTPIPESIRIGAFDYVVTDLPKEESDRHGIGGDFSEWNLEIRVLRESKIQRQAEILMHEVLHGAWKTADLGESNNEETVVSRLAFQMIQILRDNPNFVRFLDFAAESGS